MDAVALSARSGALRRVAMSALLPAQPASMTRCAARHSCHGPGQPLHERPKWCRSAIRSLAHSLPLLSRAVHCTAPRSRPTRTRSSRVAEPAAPVQMRCSARSARHCRHWRTARQEEQICVNCASQRRHYEGVVLSSHKHENEQSRADAGAGQCEWLRRRVRLCAACYGEAGDSEAAASEAAPRVCAGRIE